MIGTKNTLFVGNGFDLELGMPTSYRSFAESEFWIKDFKDSGLCQALNKAKENSSWFDIEGVMLKYAKSQESVNIDSKLDADKRYFHSLTKNLYRYLREIETPNNLSHANRALDVLQIVADDYQFDDIYTFNYTSIENVVKSKKIGWSNKTIHHLHGSLETNDIILGIPDKEKAVSRYDFLFKSYQEGYKSEHVAETLKQSKEIVFFGLSFGAIDSIYFEDFFQSVARGEYIGDKRKCITIFTYDKNSKLEIFRNLRNIGVNASDLYTYSEFSVILTSLQEGESQRNIDNYTAFYKRIKMNITPIAI